MTRSFDVFDRDDFRGSDSGSERGMGGGSNSSWDNWRERQSIHREEERSDALARDGQQRSGRDRPPVPREERVREVVQQRMRTNYTDRNKSYSLRDSEIHTLSEVGKFRVVAKNDLARFAYNGDRDRMENDIEHLARQGLAKVTTIPNVEYSPTKVVTLIASLGCPVFACTPDQFPSMMAAALTGKDLQTWAAEEDVALIRGS